MVAAVRFESFVSQRKASWQDGRVVGGIRLWQECHCIKQLPHQNYATENLQVVPAA